MVIGVTGEVQQLHRDRRQAASNENNSHSHSDSLKMAVTFREKKFCHDDGRHRPHMSPGARFSQ